MRVVVCHNRYQQPGGEDRVFETEIRTLEDLGHDVARYEVHNGAVDTIPVLRLAARTIWSRECYDALRRLVRRHRADVVHCHNTLPLISPAAYYAAHAEDAAVVQTLHNFRLCCPNALLYRNGRLCEECVGRSVPWPAVQHACYRDSRPASAAVGAMLVAHSALGTWHREVDCYIALSAFARQVFVRHGLPENRLAVKPNAIVPDPGIRDGRDGGVIFVGRLTQEKGIRTLLAAWDRLRQAELTVVGDGPLAGEVRAAAARNPSIRYLGHLSGPDVVELVGRAGCLVCPSEWYEGCPLVVAEALACGTPVIASRLGALEEMVSEGLNGFLFGAGDVSDLAATVRRALEEPARLAAMRLEARHRFELQFSESAAARALTSVYERAVQEWMQHGQSRRSAPAVAGSVD